MVVVGEAIAAIAMSTSKIATDHAQIENLKSRGEIENVEAAAVLAAGGVGVVAAAAVAAVSAIAVAGVTQLELVAAAAAAAES